MAPISVKLTRQFIGRASTHSWPRWTYACERPIAMFTPASSTGTNRRASMAAMAARNASRLARTSGRSHSRRPRDAQVASPAHRAEMRHLGAVGGQRFVVVGTRRHRVHRHAGLVLPAELEAAPPPFNVWSFGDSGGTVSGNPELLQTAVAISCGTCV